MLKSPDDKHFRSLTKREKMGEKVERRRPLLEQGKKYLSNYVPCVCSMVYRLHVWDPLLRNLSGPLVKS